MNQSVIAFGGEMFTKAVVVIENTEIVNRKMEFSFMYLTIPVCMVTILLNLSVVMMLWKNEKTIVNQLMMLDCLVNIMYSSLSTFEQSPWYRGLGVEVYCCAHLVLLLPSMILNRLLPVAIVVFR
jgi:hypothetical protein